MRQDPQAQGLPPRSDIGRLERSFRCSIHIKDLCGAHFLLPIVCAGRGSRRKSSKAAAPRVRHIANDFGGVAHAINDQGPPAGAQAEKQTCAPPRSGPDRRNGCIVDNLTGGRKNL